ncbi:pleckstrin homology domain-containing family B member 1 [Spea bombifrons]|uniref:pleckstrin homology domain-containing family B member 1 n=1 Tax=Spea bombifrons TaxID=233779 RepID=UPI00234BB0B2|nr:pleckstrin homology domain-containing family B member 1 [Spea bombifrons]
MALVKSGWLWRQSSVLRRWKRHWFDLWMDGGLVYYPDETRRNIEERILLKFNCVNVKAGLECGDIQPPEGGDREALVTVDLRDQSRLLLCAESPDDAAAWKLALLDAKMYPVYVYDPYDDHYQAVPLNAHHAVYINPGYGGCGYGPGMTPVIIRDDPYRSTYGEQLALGMLAGAVTGSALGSLMWLPCWF